MALSASELRANIYRLLDQVLETGVPLEVARKGQIIRIVPEKRLSKLSRLVRRDDAILGDPEGLVDMDWSDEWQP